MASSKAKAKLRLLRASSSNETDRLNQTLFVIHFENRKKAFQQEQLFLLTGAYFANPQEVRRGGCGWSLYFLFSLFKWPIAQLVSLNLSRRTLIYPVDRAIQLLNKWCAVVVLRLSSILLCPYYMSVGEVFRPNRSFVSCKPLKYKVNFN